MIPSHLNFEQPPFIHKVQEALNIPDIDGRIHSLKSIIHEIKNSKSALELTIAEQREQITQSNDELKETKNKLVSASPTEHGELRAKIERLSEKIISLDEKIKSETPSLKDADLALLKAETSLDFLEY